MCVYIYIYIYAYICIYIYIYTDIDKSLDVGPDLENYLSPPPPHKAIVFALKKATRPLAGPCVLWGAQQSPQTLNPEP